MTIEQLTRANQLKHEIDVCEKQLDILRDIMADEKSPALYHSEIGSVTIEPEWKGEVIDFIIDKITEHKDELEIQFECM